MDNNFILELSENDENFHILKVLSFEFFYNLKQCQLNYLQYGKMCNKVLRNFLNFYLEMSGRKNKINNRVPSSVMLGRYLTINQ